MHRRGEAREAIKKFKEFTSTCHYCGWLVMMKSEEAPPYRPRPDDCWCLGCGQRYFCAVSLAEEKSSATDAADDHMERTSTERGGSSSTAPGL
jgi:hypothetical protein